MKLIQAPRPPGIWDLRTARISLWPAVTINPILVPLPSRTALVAVMKIRSFHQVYQSIHTNSSTMINFSELTFPILQAFQLSSHLCGAIFDPNALIMIGWRHFRPDSIPLWRENAYVRKCSLQKVSVTRSILLSGNFDSRTPTSTPNRYPLLFLGIDSESLVL